LAFGSGAQRDHRKTWQNKQKRIDEKAGCSDAGAHASCEQHHDVPHSEQSPRESDNLEQLRHIVRLAMAEFERTCLCSRQEGKRDATR
jgi:hypothetical protein